MISRRSLLASIAAAISLRYLPELHAPATITFPGGSQTDVMLSVYDSTTQRIAIVREGQPFDEIEWHDMPRSPLTEQEWFMSSVGDPYAI